jgi:DNA invertase Pin-like site-specific DNA recombinase
MKILNNYNVGIYCRLSRDDHNGNLESMSISNQRQVLMDYVREKGWTLKDCYVDDGFSGTNFDRPDFKRMIRDVECGRIDCIITKDLSRLGRNYVQTGYYTDEYFVENDIRFIAVNDGIDTMKDNNDIAAFHHVLNEFYPKQVSKKVRQVKKKSAEQGKFMGSQAPYGYIKSPEDKHVLIIDEEAADIVRRLFFEFAGGDTARQIATRLNDEHIDTPRFYHYAKTGRPNPLSKEKNVWGSTSIMQLLRNQVYIGNMVQGKREVISFKTKKRRVVDPSDWIIVENTHTAIVDKNTWDKVQNRISKNGQTRKTKDNSVALFSGIVRCADCGSPLAYMRRKYVSYEKGVYRCSRYNNNGGKACTTHNIDEETLTEFVLNDIKQHANLALEDKEMIAGQLVRALKRSNCKEVNAINKRINECEKRVNVISQTVKNLYEDKCLGKLPENIFYDLLGKYNQEQSDIENKLPELRLELAKVEDNTNDIDEWINMISQYENLEVLTRNIVFNLIDNITVSERKKVNDKWVQEIDIEYRFIKNLLGEMKKDIA